MSVSRFFGSTNREAMRQVRLALGADALIISNRRVNGGVEILASDGTVEIPAPAARPRTVEATSPPPSQPSSPAQSYSTAQGQPATVSTVNAPASTAEATATATAMNTAPHSAPSTDIMPRAEVMRALGALQGSLETRIDELLWSQQLQKSPETLKLFQTLLAYGFSTPLLRAMLKRKPENLSEREAFEWVRNELDEHLPVLKEESLLWQPGLALAIVGPTGVGKTTTIAKLAARAVKQFGPDNVVLITTDTYRIGAHEQLKIYADILRVNIHVVNEANAFRQVMLGIRPEQVVLIDNVGISQRDSYVNDQATLLAASGRRVQRLLALNASSHGDTLDEVARTYKRDGGTPLLGCIITKTDEATRVGPALDTAIRYQLPIHYISNGQKVPENLRFLTAKQLVDLAFLRTDYNAKALYAPTSGDLAALLAQAHPDAVEEQQKFAEQKATMARMFMQSTGAQRVQFDVLRDQLQALAASFSLGPAYDAWAAAQAGSFNDKLMQEQGLSALRDAVHETQEQLLLSTYQCVKAPLEPSRQLLVNGLYSSQGQVLGSAQQQLAGMGQWQATTGEHILAAKSTAEQQELAMRWVQAQQANAKVVHAFEALSTNTLRAFVLEKLNIISAITPSTRFWHIDGTTTANALAKQLVFSALPQQALGSLAFAQAVLNLPDCQCWYAQERVHLKQRGYEDVAVTFASLRFTDNNQGATVKEYVFLHALPLFSADDGTIPALLLTHLAARQLGRLSTNVWRQIENLALVEGLSAMQIAHLATLCATALFAIQYAPDATHQALKQTMADLLALRTDQLSTPKLVDALLRFYALREVVL